MKKYFFVFLFFALISSSYISEGQIHSRVFRNEQFDTIPKMVVKIDPFMFFARFSHISVSGEFRVSPYSSLQLELGYVTRIFTDNFFYYDDSQTPFNGYRINPEWRFYSPKKGFIKFYFGPEVYLQQIFRNQNFEYGFGCSGFDCDYIQNVSLRHTQFLYGFNFIGGFQGAPDGLPFLDIFAGIGGRFQRNYYGSGPDLTNAQIRSGERLESYRSTPYITIGIKIGLVADK